MTVVQINLDLPEEFYSDILITAFDGTYGSSWDWFEPAPTADKFWLKTNGNPEHECVDDHWLSVRVRLREGMETGNPSFDSREGYVIDHASLAGALSRIINNDYLDASEAEKPLGVRAGIVQAVMDPEGADLDAIDADVIVQVAAFGKVIFG